MERLTKGERLALIVFAAIVAISLSVSYFWHRKTETGAVLSDSIKYQIEKFEAEIDSFNKANSDSVQRKKKNKKRKGKNHTSASKNKYDNNIDPKKNPLEQTNEKE